MSSSASPALNGYSGLYCKIGIIDPDTGVAAVGTEFSKDIKAIEASPAAPNSGDLTYQEAKDGVPGESPLQITHLQSLRAGSLWRFLQDNLGAQVELVWGPEGNAAPSAEKPHLVYRLKVDTAPKIGGAATTETTRFDCQTTLAYISGPEFIDA